MSELLNMTERTNERIASLEAQIEELRLLMLKNMENDNSFLSEIVEPLPIASGGGGGGNPKPFDYRTRVEGEGESARTIHEIVNNYFYWNGSLRYIPDFNCDGAVGEGDHDIYLRCVWDDDDNMWAIDLGFQPEEQSSTNPCVYNLLLYHFFDGTITRDYRDTFLSLGCRTINGCGPKYGVTYGTGRRISIGHEEDSNISVKAETIAGDCYLTIGVYYV